MSAILQVLAIVWFGTVAFGFRCQRHGAPCPDYKTVEKHQKYEERVYPPLTWVSISGDALRKSQISYRLLTQLYSYVNGANDRGETLEWMVPVRTTKTIHDEFNTYTMAIALSPRNSENPPKPRNATLTVETEPATTYVVRAFESQRMVSKDSTWDEYADSLRSVPGLNSSFYHICVYDGPWVTENRLNEVWMEKVQESDD